MINIKWKVRPTIDFKDGTIKVSTYIDHDGGYARMMIHECHRKHHLTSDQPDQISNDLTQSRTFSSGKVGLFSIEMKITDQYGSFGRLDTCNHVELDNFEKCSILIFENEDKAIANQYDVSNHLYVL